MYVCINIRYQFSGNEMWPFLYNILGNDQVDVMVIVVLLGILPSVNTNRYRQLEFELSF